MRDPSSTHPTTVDNDYKSVDRITDPRVRVSPPDFEIRSTEILLIEEDVHFSTLIPMHAPDANGYVANVGKDLQLPRPPPGSDEDVWEVIASAHLERDHFPSLHKVFRRRARRAAVLEVALGANHTNPPETLFLLRAADKISSRFQDGLMV